MNAPESVEALLIARVRRGDNDAFSTLVSTHQSRVRQQLRRLVGNSRATHGDDALADDLAQDVFVRAWQQLHAFRGEARFATWLYRIAYHRYLEHVRSAQGTHALEVCDDHGSDDVEGECPHDGAQRIDVERALARLPDAERVAIIHCHWLDLSHQEAADVLGWPLGTVKSHIARGKEKLRISLAAWNKETTS
jgi:RNA polymerase sigma-70 factor (ECF subfamily)